MILPIYSVVKLIDPRRNEAGATLGATPLHRFRRIVLPLTLPGILTGVVFVFSLSIAPHARSAAVACPSVCHVRHVCLPGVDG
jgi:ABC-type spermidine/putrescine transport system permease subunit I